MDGKKIEVNLTNDEHKSLREYLESFNYEDDLGSKAQSHVLGMQQTIDGKLSYIFKAANKLISDNLERNELPVVDRGELSFSIVAKKDCREPIIPITTPSSGEKTQEER